MRFLLADKMEIKITDDKKNKLIAEVKGVDHTLCNVLKTELWNDKHVKIAAYSIRHPQISVPQIIVETDGEESPRNALLAAVQRIHKTNEKFKKEFSKEIK
jgi:DNA-directed RNA polymerase subunit L